MATNAFAMQHDAGRENDNCIGLKLAKNIKSCLIGPEIKKNSFFLIQLFMTGIRKINLIQDLFSVNKASFLISFCCVKSTEL